MAQLYADENFPLAAVEELRCRGHNVMTAHEAGKANKKIPDDEVLAYAISERRALLTYNRRDFIRLHNNQPGHSGIIVCTADRDAVGLAKRIHEAIGSQTTLDGQLIRVIRPSR
jgi:hypothetical protein